MSEDEYLEQRLNDQINWYEAKSKSNQNWHKGLRTIEIIAAAIIPFLAGFGQSTLVNQIILGILGVIIAVCAGLSILNKYQENWLNYRTTAETLMHEKFLFLTKTSPYDETEPFQSLVERVGGLISKENSQWSRHSKKKAQNQ